MFLMISIGSRIHGRVQMFKSIKKIKELLKKEDQELVNDSDNNVMISILLRHIKLLIVPAGDNVIR